MPCPLDRHAIWVARTRLVNWLTVPCAAIPATSTHCWSVPRLRFLSRQPKLAIVDLEKALSVNSNDVASLQLLLQSQENLGLTREAAQTRDRADRARDRVALMDRLTKDIDQRPNDPEPRWLLGRAAIDGEMYVLAYQCFQAALDIDPGYKPARDALEMLRTQRGFDYGSTSRLRLQPMRRPGPLAH